ANEIEDVSQQICVSLENRDLEIIKRSIRIDRSMDDIASFLIDSEFEHIVEVPPHEYVREVLYHDGFLAWPLHYWAKYAWDDEIIRDYALEIGLEHTE
ncbi:MAG: hypothetical protein AAGM67_12700, partial [Bacteroidota bacterium]